MRRGTVFTDTEPGARFGRVSLEPVGGTDAENFWGPDYFPAAPRTVIP